MQTKHIALSILASALLISGSLFFVNRDSEARPNLDRSSATRPVVESTGAAVTENGIQYVDILARGGYSPRVTKAKAGVPTVIRMKTENTYDCSMALIIPSIGYQSYLGSNGIEEIQIPVEKTEGTLQGLCSMAMYRFQVEFE